MVLDVSSLDVTAGNEVEARKTGATVVPSDSVMHFYIYIYIGQLRKRLREEVDSLMASSPQDPSKMLH